MVFHGKERMDHHTKEHLHESPAVIWVPLVALAVPSLVAGVIGAGPMVFGDYFGSSLQVLPAHDVLHHMALHFEGAGAFIWHGMLQPPFWLAMSGVVVAWFLYLKHPSLPARIASAFKPLHALLLDKYGFDRFYEWFFAGGARGTGGALWRWGDVAVIDGVMVNGSAKLVGWVSGVMRQLQSGYLYHYAFAMIIGLLALLGVFVHHLLV